MGVGRNRTEFARKFASAERRDALKAALHESQYRWKLSILPVQEDEGAAASRWRVRIADREGVSTPSQPAEGEPAAAKPRPLRSEEHEKAISAHVHEQELLRGAMEAERKANAKERLATEIERQAMAEARAMQAEVRAEPTPLPCL